MEDVGWPLLTIPRDSVLEVALEKSSVGFGEAGWCAILVRDMVPHGGGGRVVEGALLGTEAPLALGELASLMATGGVHLCSDDPCGCAGETEFSY